MNKKKLLPLRRREKNSNEEEVINSTGSNKNIPNKPDDVIRKQNFPEQSIDFPEFLKVADNEQFYQSYIRIRQRHMADGAVSLNIEEDDIADRNIELYENKGINIEQPHINEHTAKSKEYFMESTTRNKFSKTSKGGSRLNKQNETKTKIVLKKDQTVSPHPPAKHSTKVIERTTEEEMFSLFDVQLTKIILESSNKVALIFLFAQGLLAGKLFY